MLINFPVSFYEELKKWEDQYWKFFFTNWYIFRNVYLIRSLFVIIYNRVISGGFAEYYFIIWCIQLLATCLIVKTMSGCNHRIKFRRFLQILVTAGVRKLVCNLFIAKTNLTKLKKYLWLLHHRWIPLFEYHRWLHAKEYRDNFVYTLCHLKHISPYLRRQRGKKLHILHKTHFIIKYKLTYNLMQSKCNNYAYYAWENLEKNLIEV